MNEQTIAVAADDPLEAGNWCSLHPRVVWLWRVQLLGRAVFAVVTAALAAFMAGNLGWIGDLWRIAIPVTVGVIALTAAALWPGAAYRRWRFRLAAEALELERGVVVRRRSAVPYRRVQQVDLTRNPIDRMLGLTAADLTTAAATSDGSIPGLGVSDAERFRLLVLERSGRDDAV